MNEYERNYILDQLSIVENYLNEKMEDGLEKNNALAKIAEAVFWITYEGDSNE